jgi:hypothetical protein
MVAHLPVWREIQALFIWKELVVSERNNNDENLDLALRLMSDKLGRQGDANKALQSKIGVMLGFVSAIVGITVIMLKADPGLFGVNLLTVGIVSLFTSLTLLVLASRTREYLDPPNFPAFYSAEALAKNHIDMKNQVIADMRASYEQNARTHQRNAVFFNWGLYFFLLSLVLTFLGIIESK